MGRAISVKGKITLSTGLNGSSVWPGSITCAHFPGGGMEAICRALGWTCWSWACGASGRDAAGGPNAVCAKPVPVIATQIKSRRQKHCEESLKTLLRYSKLAPTPRLQERLGKPPVRPECGTLPVNALPRPIVFKMQK